MFRDHPARASTPRSSDLQRGGGEGGKRSSNGTTCNDMVGADHEPNGPPKIKKRREGGRGRVVGKKFY